MLEGFEKLESMPESNAGRHRKSRWADACEEFLSGQDEIIGKRYADAVEQRRDMTTLRHYVKSHRLPIEVAVRKDMLIMAKEA